MPVSVLGFEATLQGSSRVVFVGCNRGGLTGVSIACKFSRDKYGHIAQIVSPNSLPKIRLVHSQSFLLCFVLWPNHLKEPTISASMMMP
jgi:hypothetical protein